MGPVILMIFAFQVRMYVTTSTVCKLHAIDIEIFQFEHNRIYILEEQVRIFCPQRETKETIKIFLTNSQSYSAFDFPNCMLFMQDEVTAEVLVSTSEPEIKHK
jgi:hypothetical protein